MEANTLLVEHEIWFRIDNCFAVSNKGRVKSLARDVPNKPVIQIDLLTNEIIATYKSITDAKKAVYPNSTHNNIAM